MSILLEACVGCYEEISRRWYDDDCGHARNGLCQGSGRPGRLYGGWVDSRNGEA